MGLPHPCLILVTMPGDDIGSLVTPAVDGGVDVVLWHDARTKIVKRDPTLTCVVTATKERAILVAAGDWETYIRLGIRRIHLPERSAPVGVVKFRIGNGALIGKSVRSVEAAVQAEAAGADYVIVGDVFHSESDGTAPLGLGLLREVSGAVRISVIAMSVVTPDNVLECIKAGAAGVAVAASIFRDSGPRTVAEEYRTALDAAWASRGKN